MPWLSRLYGLTWPLIEDMPAGELDTYLEDLARQLDAGDDTGEG